MEDNKFEKTLNGNQIEENNQTTILPQTVEINQQKIGRIKFYSKQQLSTQQIQAIKFLKQNSNKKLINSKNRPYTFQQFCDQTELYFNFKIHNKQTKNSQEFFFFQLGDKNIIFIYQQLITNLLRSIKQWSIIKLSIIDFNHNDQNYKNYSISTQLNYSLPRINFTCLIRLYLERLNIMNIQFLSFINLSNICQISLAQNLIRSLQPLDKIIFKNNISKYHPLRIDLTKNRIEQKSFSRALFKYSTQISFLISIISSRQTLQLHIDRDINFLAKHTSWTYKYDKPKSIKSNKILQRIYPSFFKINKKLDKALKQIITSEN